jgi:hypothetical protein
MNTSLKLPLVSYALRLSLPLFMVSVFCSCSNPSAAWPDNVEPAPAIPLQSEIPKESWAFHGASFDSTASYDITARVLSAHDYPDGADDFSLVSPRDLALGWGVMSDSAVLKHLNINQGSRFYHYEWWGSPPAPPLLISISSANTHLIPSTEVVAAQIAKIKAGDVVHLQGKLVNIRLPGGQNIATSTTRADTGAGACEVLWVEEVSRTPPP